LVRRAARRRSLITSIFEGNGIQNHQSDLTGIFADPNPTCS
jgi:hypothetical protein